ncbi:MAG TPA: PDZ domain-containing protein [Pyrinomonadaceae bacterium]|nr:PDZ domain-containing protein [Pyrinomonadaceae bacterium]
MSDNSEVTMAMPAGANQTTCSNCHSTMPSDLRFCRNCGFRLANAMGAYTSPQMTTVTDDMARAGAVPKKKRRLSGMSWIFIGLLVFFVCAAAFTALVTPIRNRGAVGVRAPVVKSYIGVDEFQNTDQGVIFEAVSAPGGPADQAGLVGGDVIVKFDGQPVQNEDQMDELMVNTPVGKTVEVEYLRDGEKKTTKLTTINQQEFNRLSRNFDRRPEGRAVFGYDDDDAERVLVPGTNIYGVKLGDILRSRPADLAGIKSGDIVTEFDGVPIRTPEEFLMRVRRAMPYSTVKLVVMRSKTRPPEPVEGEPPPPPPVEQSKEFEKLEIPVKLGRQ